MRYKYFLTGLTFPSLNELVTKILNKLRLEKTFLNNMHIKKMYSLHYT